MAKKAHPKELRLGYLDQWSSRWFKEDNLKENLQQDNLIRTMIKERYDNGGIAEIVIKRSPDEIKVAIETSRPGLIIGRGGEEIKKLKRDLKNKLDTSQKINIDINEIRNPEMRASIIAQEIAEQIERRVPHRKAMKRALGKINIKEDGVQGVKIQVSGRLNGTAIARTEHIEKGKIPLQTIRGNIEYYLDEANTKWGSIGIKVWLYKGEVFEEE